MSAAKDRNLKVDRREINSSQLTEVDSGSPTFDKTKSIKPAPGNFKYTSTVAYLKPTESTGTKCSIEMRIKGKAPKRKASELRQGS